MWFILIYIYAMTHFDINILVKSNGNFWIRIQKLFLRFSFVKFWFMYTRFEMNIPYRKTWLIKIYRTLCIWHLWSTLNQKQKKMKDNKKNNSELSSNLKCLGTPCAYITQNAGCILHCTLYKGCILGEKETKHRFFSYFFIYRHFTSKSVFIGEMKHSFGSIKTRLIPSYTF